MSRKAQHEDLTGRRFGKLVVQKEVGHNKYGYIQWLCLCDCGNTVIASTNVLKRGARKTCGCYYPKLFVNNKRLYSVWRGMRTRCENKNNNRYNAYGGRGIKVCDEWKSFESFLEWSMKNGYDPNAPRGKCTIDRIDVNGDYCPENCRWVDAKTQARNSTRNHIVTIDNESMPLVEACEKYGIKVVTVKMRMRKGWDEVSAITTPLYCEMPHKESMASPI